MKNPLLPAALAVILLSSCSTLPRRAWRGPASAPESLVIVATNDLHGQLAPDQGKGKSGGAAVLASYVKAIRREHPGRVIWLDSGDHFQGTFESNSLLGKPMVEFLNAAGLDFAAIGNHEFDFGAGPGAPAGSDRLAVLKQRMTEAAFRYAAANIVEAATGRMPELPNAAPSFLRSYGGIQVGVIGLAAEETPQTTLAANVEGLLFTSAKEAVEREAKSLRERGAEVVLLAAHIGLDCDAGPAGKAARIRMQSTEQGECDEGEMVQLLRAIPPGTVDAAVAGHTHDLVHHWVNGTPVVQSHKKGHYINLIHLKLDPKTRRVLPEQTQIEGPIPVCPEVYGAQTDCNQGPPAVFAGPTAPPVFRGQAITPDPDVERIVRPALEQAAAIKARVIAQVDQPIQKTETTEGSMGNLVADAIRHAAGADAVVLNPFGLRSKSFPPGPLTWGMVYDCLPFDNVILRAEVSGKELKDILINAENGEMGYFAVSGVTMSLDRSSRDWVDRNGNGTLDRGERVTVRSMKLVRKDGSVEEIQDSARYKVAMTDFVIGGGDFMGWSTEPIRPRAEPVGVMRDAVIRYIEEVLAPQGPLNSSQHPLVNPSRPRY